MEKILIVEDDESIRQLLELTLANFQYEPIAFENGLDAREYLDHHEVDLAILDLMVPGMDGFALIEHIRASKTHCNLPVLVLSAKDKELDKVHGLDLGADDYMTKPFSILELAARLRSLLRRSKSQARLLSSGIITLDQEARKVLVNEREVELTYKEYELLRYLMSHPARAIEREELISKIWGYDFIGESRTLDVHINSLRRKLGPEAAKYIQSVRQVGYRFQGPKDDA